jgi:predicted  nucleic acid-binding Zn-ribbon protein
VYEILKKIQEDTAAHKLALIEFKSELQAVRGHMLAMQQDIHNLYMSRSRDELRLDRIERRLELAEPATA